MAKIGDTFYEIQHFSAGEGPEGRGFLAKVTVEDPADYNISVDVATGELKFTPKPQAAPTPAPMRAQPKYDLTREGDLWRVRALRDIPRYSIIAGQRGGLVSGEHNLSQRNDAWVTDSCRVLGESCVSGDALVGHDSVVDGGCHVSGAARVHSCTLTGGVCPSEFAYMQGCMVTTRDGGKVSLSGNARFDDTVIWANGRRMHFAGGNVEDGRIQHQHELLSIFHSTWGWLSAYPDQRGRLRFKVGCQVRDSFDGLRDLAANHRVSDQDRALMEVFLQMVGVAQGFWTSPPKSAEVVQPVAAPDPAADAVPVAGAFRSDH